jgi:hypothetical protein
MCACNCLLGNIIIKLTKLMLRSCKNKLVSLYKIRGSHGGISANYLDFRLFFKWSTKTELRSGYEKQNGAVEEKRPLGRSISKCKDNIKMHLTETVWGCGLDSSGTGCSLVVGSCECGQEVLGSDKVGEFSNYSECHFHKGSYATNLTDKCARDIKYVV